MHAPSYSVNSASVSTIQLTISVVLMDELDQLVTAKQDVVYNFFNWPTMRDSQMFVIAVANRMDLPQHLAAKIKSRLGISIPLSCTGACHQNGKLDADIQVSKHCCSNHTTGRTSSRLCSHA